MFSVAHILQSLYSAFVFRCVQLMPQLRILWVCNNMLFGLPAELAKLNHLVELEADGNVGMQVCSNVFMPVQCDMDDICSFLLRVFFCMVFPVLCSILAQTAAMKNQSIAWVVKLIPSTPR